MSVITPKGRLERRVRMTCSGARLPATDSAPQMQLRRSLVLAATAAWLLTVPAVAQQLPKSYTPVAVTLPAASADPGLATFRAAIAAAAKSRIYTQLEALVQPQGFFWDRDFANGYDPRKPAVDNLAAAIELEHRNGVGWDRLAKLAEAQSVEPLDSRPGVVCAPARPGYDALEFSRLLDTTYSTETDWLYPLADGLPVRALEGTKAPIVGKLTLNFVRVLGWSARDSDTAPFHASAVKIWAQVVLPDGTVGYMEPGQLSRLTVGQLCYVKDAVVGWRIAGYIAGRN